jgi:hypothetical protein
MVGSSLLSLGLSVVTEIMLLLVSITDFQPKFGSKSTLHDTTEPISLLLAHTMVFVGSIWKNKNGWLLGSSLLCPWGCQWSQKLCYDCWGPSLIFNPSLAQNQPHTTPQSQ